MSAPLCDASEAGVAFDVRAFRCARVVGPTSGEVTLTKRTLVKTIADSLRMNSPVLKFETNLPRVRADKRI